MKVAVLGGGAIGSLIGGLIKHHAPEVDILLLVRGEHGAAIQRTGFVEVKGPWPTRRPPVAASFREEDMAGSDFVLITVKSQATEAAIHSAEPYLGDATVISLQNGLNDETLLRRVRPEKLVMGLTATNVTIVAPGRVSLQFVGSIVVGPNSARSNEAASRRAAELLRKTGLQVSEDANVQGARYNKLAINAPGYASCLSQSNFITEGVCYGPWRRHVGLPLVEECIRIFDRGGIELSRIPGLPDVRGLRWFFRIFEIPVAGSIATAVAKRKYNKKPLVYSLYQDLLRGNGTEVDFTNGSLVRMAKQAGMEAPYNSLLVELTHELEKRGPGSFFTRDEVIRRFQQVGSSVARDT
jgi:2-dehydropantoate 2-reductase